MLRKSQKGFILISLVEQNHTDIRINSHHLRKDHQKIEKSKSQFSKRDKKGNNYLVLKIQKNTKKWHLKIFSANLVICQTHRIP
jgi:hypothetical protein